jgi:hypothetical protein
MPSASKARTAMFEHQRTSSYHVRSIAAVQQSSKSSATFKLIVHRETGAKRYEFEAESPRLAGASSRLGLPVRGLTAPARQARS